VAIPKLEVNINKGIETIDRLLVSLNQINERVNSPLIMTALPEDEKEKNTGVQTSFFRELTYCMDHCIHHQSLIKIALLEQKLIHLIDPNFGVAFSTQLYRNQCAS
jgi:hypothetical protein